MSRKHNTKHNERGTSNYPRRLKRRGLAGTPVMETVEALQKRQDKREELTGVPYWTPGSESAQVADNAA